MVVEAISCFLCSATVFFVVWSGEYLYFVTPKMKYYLYFAAGIFFLWGLYEVIYGKKNVYRRRFDSYYLLMFICASLLISCVYYNDFTKDTAGAIETLAIGNASSKEELRKGIREKGREIIVTSDNFLAWINELRINCHKYDGYTITIEGSMGLKNETNAVNDFYLIRWYMSCCAADVVPIGILCEMEGGNTMEEEAFVRIQGVICCNYSKEGESAKILVKKMARIAKPKEKYIYS